MHGMTPLRIRLREAREAKGLTQVELAAKARIPQQTISRIELGSKLMNLNILHKIAKALGVKAADLLEDG